MARGDGHPPSRASQAILGVMRICPGTRRQPTAPQGVPLGLVSATRTASAVSLGQIADRASNDSRESAGAFCCLSATTLATNVETNGRASLSQRRASFGNPTRGPRERSPLVRLTPPQLGRHDARRSRRFDCRASSLITLPNFGSGVTNGHDENELCLSCPWRTIAISSSSVIRSGGLPLMVPAYSIAASLG